MPRIYWIPLACVIASGCTERLSKQLGDLRRELIEIRRQAQSDRLRAEETANRLLILESRVATAGAPVVAVRAPRPAPQPPTPAPVPAPAPAPKPLDEPAMELDPADASNALPLVRMKPGEPVPESMPAVEPERVAVRPAPPPPEPRPEPPPEPERVAVRPAPPPPEPRPEPPPEPERVAVRPAPPPPEPRPEPPPEPERPMPEPPRLPAKALYARGLAAFRGDRLGEALAVFRAFVARFPDHSLADNATYWRGRALAKRRDRTGARDAYEMVVRRYPTGNKVPDALLALADLHASAGEKNEARAKLNRVVRGFPASEAAKVAARRLREIEP